MFLWTGRMPFIHNLVKNTLPEGWTVLAQCEKSMKKRILFSQEVFFLKRFFWTLRMQFGQSSRESSKQNAKLFAPCEKMLGNRYIVQKLRRKVPMDTWKAILTTPLKRVWQKRKNFSSMTGNAENNSIFLFLSSPKKCCRHVLSNFDNTAQKNLPDSQKKFPHSPKMMKWM